MRRNKKFILSTSQNALPFGRNRAKSGVFAYAGPFERRLLASVGAFLATVAVLYVYFVMASVAHVAEREEVSKNVAQISAEVARLEASYFTRSHAITESYARSLGFVNAKGRVFVEKTSLALSRDAR